jgi:hypothetical protein
VKKITNNYSDKGIGYEQD